MRKTWLAFAIGILFGLGGCGGGGGGGVAGGAFDEVEPNDEPSQAQDVSPPVTISGTADSDADEYDSFKFTPLANGSYTFRLDGFEGTTDLDLEVWVQVGEDTYSPVDNSENDAGMAESLTLSLTGGATYFAVVWAYDTSGSKAYTLRIAPGTSKPAAKGNSTWGSKALN